MSFVQIASWNIQHLSTRTENRQSAYALADHIEMAGIDILVLQEIAVTHKDGDQRRNEDLDLVCDILKEHLGQDWQYLMLRNRDNDTRETQLCAVMWDTSRIEATDVKRLDVPMRHDGYPVWHRTPHAIKFRVQVRRFLKDADGNWQPSDETSSLIVIPLHMKANGGDEEVDAKRRKIEAELLVERLDEVKRDLDEESLILIGDTNIKNRYEKAARAFHDYGLRDLNYLDQTTYPFYDGNPFDRVFMARGRREFEYSRQYILQPTSMSEHHRYLSDHFMIKASIKIYVDDADPREEEE